MLHRRVAVSVVGSRIHSPKTAQLAYQVGRIVAQTGAVLVCGGLKGVMESAAKGAREAGGLTVGLLPGRDVGSANPYIEIAIPTSVGFARNALVAAAGDIIVALPGKYGTQAEICYALFFDRPVIDLGSWNIKGMKKAANVEDAERLLKRLVARSARGQAPSKSRAQGSSAIAGGDMP